MCDMSVDSFKIGMLVSSLEVCIWYTGQKSLKTLNVICVDRSLTNRDDVIFYVLHKHIQLRVCCQEVSISSIVLLTCRLLMR